MKANSLIDLIADSAAKDVVTPSVFAVLYCDYNYGDTTFHIVEAHTTFSAAKARADELNTSRAADQSGLYEVEGTALIS